MKVKEKFGISAGISSILMVFVVLCLTTFGVLSLVTARADANMTNKTGQTIENYHEVDAKAQQKISEIDTALYTALMGARSYIVDGSYDTSSISGADADLLNSISNSDTDEQSKIQECYIYFSQLLIESIPDITTETVDFTDIVVGFTVPISDILELEAKLKLGEASGDRYNITFYGVKNIVDWSIDDSPVEFWDGT